VIRTLLVRIIRARGFRTGVSCTAGVQPGWLGAPLLRAALISATLIAAEWTLPPPQASSLAAPPADCHPVPSGSGSYCVRVDNQDGLVRIAITMASPRESTKTITYTGRSTAPGSVFRDDLYEGTSVLRYFGADKIILQDDNGNPPWVYYR